MGKFLNYENWKTTVWGFFFALVTVVALTPDLIAFLPDSWEAWVRGICGVLAAVFAFMGFRQAKDADKE